MSYFSRSCRRRFTVLNVKSWAFSCICGHCQQHLYCAMRMRRHSYLWTSGINSVRFSYPDFLLECKILATWRHFPLIFAFFYVGSPPYFYFRFVWPTDLESILQALPTAIFSTKFEVDMAIHCRVIVFSLLTPRHVTLLCDLDLWPFDLEQLSCMAGHVTNHATKFEDLRIFILELWAITSWISYH